jgi:hypothetical protein
MKETILVTLEQSELEDLLAKAVAAGAELTFKKYIRYNLMTAANHLDITPKTLAKYVSMGKIKAVDGLITGTEIDRYLGHSR